MEEIRKDFPFFMKEENKKIAYLDSGATTQKPKVVIDSITDYYTNLNANANRGSYQLAIQSTLILENTRKKVRDFINAEKVEEIIFTKSATEALNLVAYSYGLNNLTETDEVLISIAEHHANLVTWQEICRKTGAKLKYFYLDENLNFDLEDFKNKLNERTKIVAFTGQSNVLSFEVPIKKMIEKVRSKSKAVVVLDGAQLIAHDKVDVRDFDFDFLAFSGHKLYSLQGVGVLYGKYDILEQMEPFLLGGDMIEYVRENSVSFAGLPSKFEAGTMDVGAIYSLEKAIEFIDSIGFDKIRSYEEGLVEYCLKGLKELDFVKVYYPSVNAKGSSIAFVVEGVHPHDVSQVLDFYGVNIRVGHHCAQPLHRYLGINSTCRVSFAVYNNLKDVDRLIEGLKEVRKTFYGN